METSRVIISVCRLMLLLAIGTTVESQAQGTRSILLILASLL